MGELLGKERACKVCGNLIVCLDGESHPYSCAQHIPIAGICLECLKKAITEAKDCGGMIWRETKEHVESL